MKTIATVGLWATSIVLLTAPLLSAQEKTRTLEFGAYRKYDISTEPIAIIKKELGNRPFNESPGESKVIGGADWLYGLTLTLKNISSKSIQASEIHLIVPQQANMSGVRRMFLRFPTESILDPDAKTSHQMLKLWRPGHVISMKIPNSQLQLLDRLRGNGVYDIDTVSIALQRVDFDDHTGWYQGLKMHENPNLPGNWIPDRPMSSNKGFKLESALRWSNLAAPISTEIVLGIGRR